MELIKKEIHTSVLRASKYTQVTIDDDFNVPDAKPDIEKIITYRGTSVIDEVTPYENKVKIIGTVCFSVLYKTVNEENGIPGQVEVFSSEIPFEDIVNVDGADDSDYAEVRSVLEDLSVTMLNSRKFEVRGLVGNALMVYCKKDVNAASRIDNGQGIECRYKEINFTNMELNKHEVIRLREEAEIPRSKPNIKEIIWHSVALRNTETRIVSDKLQIRGELELFAIYRSEEEGIPLQYVSMTQDFSQETEPGETDEDMIIEALVTLGKGDVSVRPDADGEPRVILMEYNLDIKIKGFADESLTLISDMYSPDAELSMMTEECSYENLLMKNSAKTKVTGKERLRGSNAKIMQVCSVEGDVEPDNVVTDKESITVSGIVKAAILYVSADDDNPFAAWNTEIPFEYTVNTVPVSENDSIRIIPSLEHISVQLLGIDEVEIKATVNLDITIFARGKINTISDIEVLPIDSEKKAAMPEIVGYIVKPEDNLWSIARKYYSTTDSIKALNNLESDEVMAGDKLIIVKS